MRFLNKYPKRNAEKLFTEQNFNLLYVEIGNMNVNINNELEQRQLERCSR